MIPCCWFKKKRDVNRFIGIEIDIPINNDIDIGIENNNNAAIAEEGGDIGNNDNTLIAEEDVIIDNNNDNAAIAEEGVDIDNNAVIAEEGIDSNADEEHIEPCPLPACTSTSKTDLFSPARMTRSKTASKYDYYHLHKERAQLVEYTKSKLAYPDVFKNENMSFKAIEKRCIKNNNNNNSNSNSNSNSNNNNNNNNNNDNDNEDEDEDEDEDADLDKKPAAKRH